MALPDARFLPDERFNVAKTLRLDHDEFRQRLSRTASNAGPFGHKAKRLMRLCQSGKE